MWLYFLVVKTTLELDWIPSRDGPYVWHPCSIWLAYLYRDCIRSVCIDALGRPDSAIGYRLIVCLNRVWVWAEWARLLLAGWLLHSRAGRLSGGSLSLSEQMLGVWAVWSSTPRAGVAPAACPTVSHARNASLPPSSSIHQHNWSRQPTGTLPTGLK